MYQSNSTVLAWRDSKTAALFFDDVVPAEMADFVQYKDNDPNQNIVLREILPSSLVEKPSQNNSGLSGAVTKYMAHYFCTFPETLGITELPNGETFEDRRESERGNLIEAFNSYVLESKIENISVYGERLYKENSSIEGEPSLILSNLRLVDSSKVGWKQLLEFRKDESSKEKLRQLRHFISDKYVDRSTDFIREDIERRITEYNEVTKFWDFPTRKSIYSIGLTGSAATFLSDALGMALFGAPIATVIAGASTMLGSTGIALESRRREVNIARNKNPVAFLAEAQRLTSNASGR